MVDFTILLQLLQGIENVFIDNTKMCCSSKHKDTAVFLNKEKQKLENETDRFTQTHENRIQYHQQIIVRF